MILLTHIVIALTSIVFSGLLFMFPSKTKLFVSYGLVLLTLISGTFLVWSAPTHVLSATISGLTYIAIVAVPISISRKKVIKSETTAKETISNRDLR